MSKNIFSFLILLLFISSNATSQDSYYEVIQNAKEVNGDLIHLYELNVLKYYGLDDYQTELQKEVFKSSEEYVKYYQDLKREKGKSGETYRYIKVQKPFTETDYDIDKDGFELKLSLSECYQHLKSYILVELAGNEYEDYIIPIVLKNLPITEYDTKRITYNQPLKNRFLFLNMSSEAGLNIEHNREYVSLYLFFRLGEIKKNNRNCSDPIVSPEGRLFYGSDLRIAIINEQSNEVYYDVVFDGSITKDLLSIDEKYYQLNEPNISKQNETIGSNLHDPEEYSNAGTLDDRALYGNRGTLSNGSSLQMAGWVWDARPNPNYKTDESGKIVYKIKIDDEGYIIDIQLQSSTVKPAVERLYRQSVERLSFSKASDFKPKRITTGTITFLMQSK